MADQADTFSKDYVKGREDMLQIELQRLEALETLQQLGVEGAKEMADAQRAMVFQLEQSGAAADSLGDSFDGLMNGIGMNKDLSDSVVGRFLIAGPEGFASIAARMKDTLMFKIVCFWFGSDGISNKRTLKP